MKHTLLGFHTQDVCSASSFEGQGCCVLLKGTLHTQGSQHASTAPNVNEHMFIKDELTAHTPKRARFHAAVARSARHIPDIKPREEELWWAPKAEKSEPWRADGKMTLELAPLRHFHGIPLQRSMPTQILASKPLKKKKKKNYTPARPPYILGFANVALATISGRPSDARDPQAAHSPAADQDSPLAPPRHAPMAAPAVRDPLRSAAPRLAPMPARRGKRFRGGGGRAMGVSFVKEEPRNCSDCFGFPLKTKEEYPKKEGKPMKERVGAEGEGGVDGAGGAWQR